MVQLPLLRVVELEVPAASAIRLFPTPWNGRRAQFMLYCTHANATFHFLAYSAAAAVKTEGNVSSTSGLNARLDINH
jgi:hypothetical protein